jgi:hypothetical protein
MATELNLEISRVEMERLQTSIKYHDWFLGFVVVVGVTLSIYLIDSMNTLQEGLADVRTQIEVMHRDVDVMKEDIKVVKVDIKVMKRDIDTLNQKMERYHGDTGR